MGTSATLLIVSASIALGASCAVGCSDSSGEQLPTGAAGQGGSAGASFTEAGAGSDVPRIDSGFSELAPPLAIDAPKNEAAAPDAAADGPERDAASAPATGSIVPLYSDPSDPAWNAIVTAKNAHASVPVVAIVNPASGPGNRVDGSYTAGIDRLLAAGIVPIGYVSTSYTKRGEPAVKTDIDRWQTFYPKVQGIFFDEQSNAAGDDVFYRDVSQYAKGKGLTLTVGNPGTGVPAAYFDTVDVMLIYEEAGLPQLPRLAGFAAQRMHYGIIPYAAALDPTFVAAAKVDVGYIYVTNDDLPNPWDTLAPSFGQLLDALSR